MQCPKCNRKVLELFPCINCDAKMCQICARSEMYEIRHMSPRGKGIIAHFNICKPCGKEMYDKGLKYRTIQ